MAKLQFKNEPSNSPELFPENIFDKIPQDHPVRLVKKVVEGLNISHILKHYKTGGCPAYHPRTMIKILFYSYLSNIYSCRKIAKALNENIHFMYIAGNSTPDFRTINDFRGKILKEHIKELFAEVVKLLVEEGYVSLDIQYIDGTKIESASNKYTFVWRGSVEKYKEKLELKIKGILQDIEASIQSDNQEINREELPKKIDSEVLKEKLALINKRLSEPTKKQEKEIQKLQNKHLPRLEKYENDLRVMGDRNSYSKTDINATFMRMKDDHMQNGQLKPAYNTQISTENQFITHVSIHQTPGDTTTLEEHLNSFEQQYQKQSKEVCADAGYGSEENYEMLENKGVVAYVKYNYFHKEQKKKQKENPFLPQNMFYNSKEDYYVCPMGQKMTNVGIGKRSSSNGYESEVAYYQAQRCEGCPLRALCHKSKGNRKIEVNYRLNELKSQAKKLLNSERGHYHRSKRPIEVEAVFGQLKNNNKFNRFTFRGLEKVEMEFLLMALGHNFRKWSSRQANSTQKTSKSAIFTSNFCSNIAFINYILPKPDEILKKSRYLNPIKIAA